MCVWVMIFSTTTFKLRFYVFWVLSEHVYWLCFFNDHSIIPLVSQVDWISKSVYYNYCLPNWFIRFYKYRTVWNVRVGFSDYVYQHLLTSIYRELFNQFQRLVIGQTYPSLSFHSIWVICVWSSIFLAMVICLTS